MKSESYFDDTIGSFDGAEVYEFVGLYIKSNLEYIIPKTNLRLFRDDELILSRNLNGQEMNKKRINIIRIFKDIAFIIDIQTNLKEVHFLAGSLNLQNGTYRQYKKSNDKFLNIHISLKHPQQTIKQSPNSRNSFNQKY